MRPYKTKMSMSKKLLYSIVVDIISYLPALISWLMTKNISLGLAKKDLQLFAFGWGLLGAVMIYFFYKNRIGIFGGSLQVVQGILKSLNIISLMTPMPVAIFTWIIMGFYNVIQALVNGTRNVQRKMVYRRQQKRYEHLERTSKKPKQKKTVLAWPIFLFPFVFIYDYVACVIFNETAVNDATSFTAMMFYNAFIIFIWYFKLRNSEAWRRFKSSAIATITKFLDWFKKTIPFGKIVLYGGLLILTNVFNLLSPFFNFITDQDIIFVDPVVNLFTDKHKILESRLAWRGQNWTPPIGGQDLNYWIRDASEIHQVKMEDLAAVLCAESDLSMTRVPYLVGEPSGGTGQIQPKLAKDRKMRVTGRSEHFMDSKMNFSSRLEWQRVRHLAMICGIKTNDPILDYLLSWIQYFVISSIDDRFSSKAIYFTAEELRKRYLYYKNNAQYKATEIDCRRAAIATWPFGEGKKAWKNRNSEKINSYVEKGRAYAAKYGS